MSPGVQKILLFVPIFLFSLCVHEFAHAWMAVRRGDKTPMLAGRLTMHPMAHADFFGTLLLPILCAYNGWPMFGWAKPVPVNYRNMKLGRLDMALVAAAGPVSNLILAVLFTAALGFLIRIPDPNPTMQTLPQFALLGVQVNLILAFFNLIPIPPLDGFQVLQGIMPNAAAKRMEGLFRYSGILLIAMLVTGLFGIISIPVNYCREFLFSMIGLV